MVGLAQCRTGADSDRQCSGKVLCTEHEACVVAQLLEDKHRKSDAIGQGNITAVLREAGSPGSVDICAT